MKYTGIMVLEDRIAKSNDWPITTAICKISMYVILQNDHLPYLNEDQISLPNRSDLFSTERSCGNPGVPANGNKNSTSYKYGNSVKFECNSGYSLQGSEVRTCQTNGLWTGTQPTCQSKPTSPITFDERQTVTRNVSF